MRKDREWICHFILICFLISSANAESTCLSQRIDGIEAKIIKEEFIPLKYIAIAFYKPNYFLPFYYTGSPYDNFNVRYIPNNKRLKNTEVKYQLSGKLPLWEHVFNLPTSFNFAFTLLTYWQAHNHGTFVRETNYEPEFFFANHINYCMLKNWHLNFLNLGYSHQSNGCGGRKERAWDRIYLEAVTSMDNFMLSIKPWYSLFKYYRNSDIEDYLGYGRLLAAYNFQQHVFAIEITNLFVTPSRTSFNLTWSIPLTTYVKGYIEVFSGYGQSLLEYNHRTNSAGLGFAVSDWL